VVGVTPRRLGACARLGKRGASGGATSGGGPGARTSRAGAAWRARGRSGVARGRRRGARARVLVPNDVDYPCLTEYNSKILN
jgi:hypothetical protein